MGAENDLFFSVGIDIDLVLVWVSHLTWFLCEGGKLLGFSVGFEIDFVFVWAGEIDLI